MQAADTTRPGKDQTSDGLIQLEPGPIRNVQLMTDVADQRGGCVGVRHFDLFLYLPYPGKYAPDRLGKRGSGVLHARIEWTETTVPGRAAPDGIGLMP